MSDQSSYRLVSHATFRETTSQLKMLFDRERGVMYELNETASSILERLQHGQLGLDELVSSLTAEYSADESEIRRDVQQLLADFVDAGLLVVEPTMEPR
jgi:PqqD family protein of HPr-rel-A system